MEPKWNGYSISWTQPYSVSMNPFYAPGSASELMKEIAVIEAIDRLVDSGLTHPEADRILNKLRQQGEGNV